MSCSSYHRNRTAGGYDQAPEDRSVNTQGRRHSFGWSNVYPSSESKASERWEGVEDVTELDDSDKDEVFAFLFDLRESGETNMWGAGRYVQEEFGFDKNLARDITLEWMKNFKEISRRMGRESKAKASEGSANIDVTYNTDSKSQAQSQWDEDQAEDRVFHGTNPYRGGIANMDSKISSCKRIFVFRTLVFVQ